MGETFELTHTFTNHASVAGHAFIGMLQGANLGKALEAEGKVEVQGDVVRVQVLCAG